MGGHALGQERRVPLNALRSAVRGRLLTGTGRTCLSFGCTRQGTRGVHHVGEGTVERQGEGAPSSLEAQLRSNVRHTVVDCSCMDISTIALSWLLSVHFCISYSLPSSSIFCSGSLEIGDG